MKNGLISILGLSGSGKTTLSLNIKNKLKKKNINPIILDGDIVRGILSNKNYTISGRRQQFIRLMSLSVELVEQGHLVITNSILYDISTMNKVRKKIDNYCEVFINFDVDYLHHKIDDNLYKKYFRGEINDVVGLDIAYEVHEAADIFINKNYENLYPDVNRVLSQIWFINDF